MCIRDRNIEYLEQRRGDDPYESTPKRLPYELATGVVAPTFPVDQ